MLRVREDPGVAARLGNIGRHCRAARDMHVVTQHQMPREHRGAADGAALADGGRARHTHAGRHRGMCADAAVVADHDLVVELHAVREDGVFKGAAVDGGVGADFDVIAQRNAAELRDLAPGALAQRRIRREAETIGPQHRTAVQDDSGADLDAFVQRDVGMQPAIGPDGRSGADDATRTQHRAPSDTHAGFDDAVRADTHAFFDDRVGRNHGGGMGFSGQGGSAAVSDPLRDAR
ncbi:hypothetical protein FI667_g8294, partial [Globisporangium splendens]